MMQLLHGKPKEEKPKKEEPKKSNPGPKLRPNIQRPKESSSEAAEIEVEPANDEVGNLEIEFAQSLVDQIVGGQHPLLVHQIAIDTCVTQTLVYLVLVIVDLLILDQDLGLGTINIR